MEPDQKVKLPSFPTIDTSTLKGFSRDFPMIAAWAEVVIKKEGDEYKALGESTISDLEKVAGKIDRNKGPTQAQTDAIAKKYMQQALGNSANLMAMMENASAITGQKIEGMEEAKKMLDGLAKEKKLKVEATDANPLAIPGGDNVSELSRTNYAHYLEISKSYEAYMTHLFNSISGFVYIPPSMGAPGAWVAPGVDLHSMAVKERPDNSIGAIIERYQTGSKKESKLNATNVEKLEKAKAPKEAFLREHIRHVRKMNELGTTALHDWAGLYLPTYKQRMVPAVEGYWRVCWLYLRAMQDRDVLEREYKRVMEVVRTRSRQAMQMGTMCNFQWYGDTEEEEAELKRLQQEKEVEAIKFKPKVLKEYKVGKQEDWVDWIEKNLSLNLQAQFIGFKATPGKIELNFWGFGPKATLKWNMIDDVVETAFGFGAKINVGAEIGGVGLKVDVVGDTIMKTTRIDFANGTVTEGWTQPKMSVKVGTDNASAALSGTVDPFTGKYDAQAEIQSKISIFEFSGKTGYSNTTRQWTSSAESKAGVGPLSGNASVSFDPVTQSAKYNVAASGKYGGDLAPGVKAEGGLSTPVY